jgi:methionine-rich copper-binding protein CopC
MDLNESYGGAGGQIYTTDLFLDGRENWNFYRTTTVQFNFARFCNTNPAKGSTASGGDGTYNWPASTKVYGDQEIFVEGPDGFGHYVPLPASDNGSFAANGSGFNYWFVAELRSTSPHGIKTGATINLNGSTTVNMTNGGSYQPYGQGGFAYVTGPDTIVVAGFLVNAGSPPSGSTQPQRVAGTSEVPIDWSVTIHVPCSPDCVPYQASGALTSKLPGCATYYNVPVSATDALIADLGTIAASTVKAGSTAYIEYSNEDWNNSFLGFLWTGAINTLVGYLPSGTDVLSYLTTNSQPLGGYGNAYILMAAHAFEVFEAAWEAAGRSANQVVRVYGSQFANSGQFTTDFVNMFTTYGLSTGRDRLCVAPYNDMNTDGVVVAAFSPPGTPGVYSGGWTVDALCDWMKCWAAYHGGNQSSWEGHASILQGAGLSVPLICYEAAIENHVPATNVIMGPLLHDIFSHPSYYGVIKAFLLSCQQGNPLRANSGSVLTHYFGCYFYPTLPQQWMLAVGVNQLPGLGTGNTFATPQGGAPGDGKARYQLNTSPGLQAVLDWANVTSPGAGALTVAGTTPASGATGISISAPGLTTTFSEAVESGTITFSLVPTAGGSSVSCTTSYDSGTNKASFVPSANLAYATGYTATVDATSTTGTAMASAYSWTFTTAYAAPTVSGTSPTSGTTGVSISEVLAATFSEAVSSGSISFTLKTAGGSTVPGTTSYNGTTHVATFTPSASLAYGAGYTATISATAPDGTAMASPDSWSFTTQIAPPTVRSTTPTSNAPAVGVTAGISVTFSEAMNPASLSLTLSPGASLNAPSYNSGTNTATWTPTGAGLAYDTGYTATVNGHASDGTPMASADSWSFTTQVVPPTLTGLIPAVGYQFGGAIIATSIAVVVTISATGASVSGTTSYNGTTHAVTFTPASAFTVGTKYIVTVSGAQASDGSAIPSATFPFTPGAAKSTSWFGGLGRTIS